jgi:putative transposase
MEGVNFGLSGRLEMEVLTLTKRTRSEFPGAIHHVSTRGNNGRMIFTEVGDQVRFLEILGLIAAQRGWICHAYCLMGNHYHLLLETPEPDLGAGMRHLNGRYAVWFNQRNGRKDHLFGERYHPEPVLTDEHLLQAVRYIALNPVAAGLCSRPEQWPWSSFNATIGEAPLPSFHKPELLLSFFGDDLGEAQAAFRRYVGEGLPETASLDRLTMRGVLASAAVSVRRAGRG